MLPWETLRRLLGLPAGMAPLDASELVRLAIEQPRRARLIGMALAGHTPREGPTGAILGAMDRGALDAELGAELLGCAGHRSGYAAARALLFDADQPSASLVAGIAMARMLAAEAEPDLLLALHAAPEREGREGAALGLSELGGIDAAASITRAGVEGRIRIRVAARCATTLPFDPASWWGLLEHRDLRARRLATELVYLLIRRDDASARRRLGVLGARAKESIKGALSDPELYMLPDKREALLEWASS